MGGSLMKKIMTTAVGVLSEIAFAVGLIVLGFLISLLCSV